MGEQKNVYFNQHGEVVSRGYDGRNHYEQIVFNLRQVEAIKLIIEKCIEEDHYRSQYSPYSLRPFFGEGFFYFQSVQIVVCHMDNGLAVFATIIFGFG